MTDQPQEAARSAGGRALVSLARLPQTQDAAMFEATYSDGTKSKHRVSGVIVTLGREWEEAVWSATNKKGLPL